ncbi:hypothetical protein [Paracoccus sp. N5]|uniref:helix-turn-helix transcriptional regulator n=1 Tax=Paracoccus sp. N5 TaxID=1101189 RepID=UPI00037E3443|nr:hypothetical protein [Paracoccus sp. N5]
MQKLLGASRATIGRWHREIPNFPRKIKNGTPRTENCSTRFLVSEVEAYLEVLEAGVDAAA